jgi:hypothetical protein
MCHTSLRDFLTTESRSGCFFTPPSYHLYLLYRCSTLHDGREPDTAAALYSIRNCANHIEQLVRLPPTAQGPLPRFPQTLDAFYTHILAKSQDQPHFPDVVSTIVLHSEPLPAAGIGELLGIEAFKVVVVLVGLQSIIDIPETGDSPVTLCHTSIYQFLTTESRSKLFFISPSYHFKLSYYYFRARLDHLLSNPLMLMSPLAITQFQDTLWSPQCNWHWEQFPGATSASSIHAELDQLAPLPSQTLPYHHIFSFTLNFLLLFQRLPDNEPLQTLSLIKSIESLALALEWDDTPGRWVQREFDELGITRGARIDTGTLQALELHKEQVMAMQSGVQRIEVAIKAKVLLRPLFETLYLTKSH